MHLYRRVALAALVSFMPLTAASAQRTSADTTTAPAPASAAVFNPTVHAMVFGDASYLATERTIPSGFIMGQAVGHLIASLTDRLTYFGEVTLSSQPTGYAVELERSILRYDFTDAFKLSGGRYHTPIGFWNTAFHHGTWLQTTVARPEMVKYGSQFVPTHFVGAMAEGNVPVGNLGLGYMVGVGNGRASIISRAGDAGDPTSNRAVTASLSLRPSMLYGLQLGGSYYRDRVAPAGSLVSSDEDISSGYVAWQHESPELIAEYIDVRHAMTGGDAADNHGFYVQGAYRLPGAAHDFKPYARTERIVTSPNDPVFQPLALGYVGNLGGVRYDFAPFAALKAEFRSEHFQGRPWTKSFQLNASFTIPSLFPGDAEPMVHS